MCAGDEAWVCGFQRWQEYCEERENCLVVLPERILVKARHYGAGLFDLHSIEVSGIEISALRVVHPCALVSVFGSLRAVPHPFIQVSSNRSHLPVKFGTLLGISFEDISVDAEDRLVSSRIDLIEPDHVDVRFDV